MSDDVLEHAIELIKLGKPLEAQMLLKPIIAADHHNLPAWIWFAKTCSTSEQRLRVLEICLEYNPDSEETKRALRDLQVTMDRKEQVISSIKKQNAEQVMRDFESIETHKEHVITSITSQVEQAVSSIKKLKAELALINIKSLGAYKEQAISSIKTQFVNEFLPFLKKIKPISIILTVLLAVACLCSLAGRMLGAGAMFYIFGVLFVFTPLFIHFIVHASIIGLVNSKQIILKPLLFLGVFSSHLCLFVCFITQTDFDDSNSGAGITNLLGLYDIKTTLSINLLDNISLTFGILLLFSWIVLGVFYFVGAFARRGTLSPPRN